jgi:hypothetical protein
MKAFLTVFYSSLSYRIKNFVLPYWKKFLRWLRHFTPEKHTRTGSIRGVLLIVLFFATYIRLVSHQMGIRKLPGHSYSHRSSLCSLHVIASLVLYLILGLLRKVQIAGLPALVWD